MSMNGEGKKDILVSVCCLAYNHEAYIRDALEGFVKQKTDFPFEVFVHDDASTDGTAGIIREYAERYPDIIRPVLQTENQHSKGVKIISEIISPRMTGKYIALCEGDDYWTDEKKLQRQVDFLEAHPECGICVHQAVKLDMQTGVQTPFTKQDREKDYSVEEVIAGGGGQFSTNSAMFRLEIYRDKPSCFSIPGVGDYPLFIYGAVSGGVHYLPEPMSVYRANVNGSWTLRVFKNTEKRIAMQKNLIAMLRRVDEYCEYRYHRAISAKIRETEYKILKAQGDKRITNRIRYAGYYLKDLKKTVNKKLRGLFPGLSEVWRNRRSAKG